METEPIVPQLTEEQALELATAKIEGQYDLSLFNTNTERISDYSVDVVFTRSMGEEVVEIRLNVFGVEPNDIEVREVMSVETARQVAVRFHGETVNYNIFRHNTYAKQRFLGIGDDGTFEYYYFAFPIHRVGKDGNRIKTKDMKYSVVQVDRCVKPRRTQLAILAKSDLRDYFIINW